MSDRMMRSMSVPVRDGLRSDGFEVSAFAPRKLEADDPPGALTDCTRGRDEILRHVDELINELTGRNGP
jgi:hypothetical protein